MASPPVCPSCGSLGVGERCAQCGARMTSEMPSIAVAGLELGAAQSGTPENDHEDS